MNTFLTKYLRPAVALTVILTIVTGFLYPGVVTVLAQAFFNHAANGSMVCNAQGQVLGSEQIGQYWTDLKYFHGRPSVTLNPSTGTPEPYAADNSTASNLGPTNATLKQDVQENLPPPSGSVPVDLVTASGSGLDPDITIAGAMYQVPVVAAARGMSQQAVTDLVTSHESGRFLGIFGEPYVNVLALNLALDGPSQNVHQC
jgi:K+-transporting ATPase ATPase C chain